MTDANSLSQWWQPQKLALDECYQATIGPLTLYLKRRQQEWLVSSEYSGDPDSAYRLQLTQASCLPELLASQRFIFRHSPAGFCLKPKLLDRPVVIKTRQSVSIPPGEQSVFYISSPLRVELVLQDPELTLFSLPIQRLSDTWFGANTQHGELCYADKTHARHSLAEIPARPHRAVTPITIENHSTHMLTIDKLSIPLPYLALYGADDGSLWTDPITLQHENLNSLARFQLNKQLPRDLTSRHQLAAPVHTPDKHGLVRAFTGIFNQ